MYSSLGSAMVLSACTTNARSLLRLWSRSGKNTSSGSPMYTYSVEDSASL